MSLQGKWLFIKAFITWDLAVWLIGQLIALIILRCFMHQDIGISILVTVFSTISYVMGGLHAISRIHKVIIATIKEASDDIHND